MSQLVKSVTLASRMVAGSCAKCFHFSQKSMLILLERKHKMAQALDTLPLVWETRMELPAQGFAWHCPSDHRRHLGGEIACEDLSLSQPLSIFVPFI